MPESGPLGVEDTRNLNQPPRDRDEIYTYHAPSELGVKRHQELAEAFKALDQIVDLIVPPGRAKSIVFTHLEEAKMMASAGVARNKETV